MHSFVFNVNRQPHSVNAGSIEELTNKAIEVYRRAGITKDYNVIYNDVRRQVLSKPKRLKGVKIVGAAVPKKGHTLKEYLDAGKALIKNVTGKTVDQKTISERGQICLRCPLLQSASDCVGCGIGGKLSVMARRAKETFGGKTFSIPEKLKRGGCGVCGCTFQLLLPARKEDLHEDTPEQLAFRKERAPFCWMLKDE